MVFVVVLVVPFDVLPVDVLDDVFGVVTVVVVSDVLVDVSVDVLFDVSEDVPEDVFAVAVDDKLAFISKVSVDVVSQDFVDDLLIELSKLEVEVVVTVVEGKT